jgi:hypothetical protein
MNIKEKYLKYKNKYLALKKQLAGAIINKTNINASIDGIYNSEDYYVSLLYHGSTNTYKNTTIPDNIYLIMSDCCGTSNHVYSHQWYTGIIINHPDSSCDKFELNITKDKLIDTICADNGLINIHDSKYIILKPGSQLCDIKLSIGCLEINKGTYCRNFGSCNEETINEKINIQISMLKPEDYNDIQRNIDLLKGEHINLIFENLESIKFCYLLPIINNIYFKYFYNMFDIKKGIFNKILLDYTHSNAISLNNMIKNIKKVVSKIDKLEPMNFNSVINGDLHKIINEYSTMPIIPKSYFILFVFIFYLFYVLNNKINSTNCNKTSYYLSDKLTEICNMNDMNKNIIVHLSSCQGSAEPLCKINKCYNLIRDIKRYDYNIPSLSKFNKHPLLIYINQPDEILTQVCDKIKETYQNIASYKNDKILAIINIIYNIINHFELINNYDLYLLLVGEINNYTKNINKIFNKIFTNRKLFKKIKYVNNAADIIKTTSELVKSKDFGKIRVPVHIINYYSFEQLLREIDITIITDNDDICGIIEKLLPKIKIYVTDKYTNQRYLLLSETHAFVKENKKVIISNEDYINYIKYFLLNIKENYSKEIIEI